MKIKSLVIGTATALSVASMAMADRGSDGHVNIIYWQAPSILNPYLSGGTKDLESSSMIRTCYTVIKIVHNIISNQSYQYTV